MLNCSATVVVIGLNQSLLGEPVAMFVTNLSLTDISFGMMLALVGLSEVVFRAPVPTPVCITLQYLRLRSAWALKVAQLVMVLDMFAAVVFPLHYHQMIHVWTPPMLAAPWPSLLAALPIGALCSALRLENFYEYGLRERGLTEEVGTDSAAGSCCPAYGPFSGRPACLCCQLPQEASSSTPVLLDFAREGPRHIED